MVDAIALITHTQVLIVRIALKMWHSVIHAQLMRSVQQSIPDAMMSVAVRPGIYLTQTKQNVSKVSHSLIFKDVRIMQNFAFE